MKASFLPALAAVLKHEAGYVNDPQDHGGATNRGVTQAVYDAWRKASKQPPRSVKFINDGEVEEIYKSRYWDAVRGDELPSGVDYCVFDFAVNSSVNRASRFLQRVVGVAEDGKIGPATVAAVKAVPPRTIIANLCTWRLHFLATLPTYPHFGKGWNRRVAEVESSATKMA